jgi:hypothetical protein
MDIWGNGKVDDASSRDAAQVALSSALAHAFFGTLDPSPWLARRQHEPEDRAHEPEWFRERPEAGNCPRCWSSATRLPMRSSAISPHSDSIACPADSLAEYVDGFDRQKKSKR